jgi:hypothetical protein
MGGGNTELSGAVRYKLQSYSATRPGDAARKRVQNRARQRRYKQRQQTGAAVLRIEVAENALVGVAMNDAPAKPISVELTAILREIVAELRGLRADLARPRRSGTADSQCDERASVLLKAIAEEVGDRLFSSRELVHHAAATSKNSAMSADNSGSAPRGSRPHCQRFLTPGGASRKSCRSGAPNRGPAIQRFARTQGSRCHFATGEK